MSLKKLIDQDAKQVVDLLYDTDVFKEKLTRDNLNAIEEYVGVIIESRVNSHIKKYELKQKIQTQNP